MYFVDCGAGVGFLDGTTNLPPHNDRITLINQISGYAMTATGDDDTVDNYGAMIGSVNRGTGVNVFNEEAAALFDPGASVMLGMGNFLTNAGTMSQGAIWLCVNGVMDGTMRKIRWIPVLVAGAVCVSPADCAVAQQPLQQKATKSMPAAPKSSGAPTAAGSSAPADSSVPPQPVWTSRCSSDGRKAALLCEIEQSLYITKTGQLVASVNVKLPLDTRQPVMMIQLQVGLFLPGESISRSMKESPRHS